MQITCMVEPCKNIYLGKIEWMSPHQLNYDFIKGLEPEGEVGCIIQCSLEYPVALHNYHSDYPLAPVKKLIPYGVLSSVARMI